jgi:alcohol dehydrogenase class IV
MNFNFSTASQIIFGAGAVGKVPDLVAGLGKRIFLVTGKNSTRSKPLAESLSYLKVEISTFQVEKEPNTTIIDEGVKLARKYRCDVVIGIGGGSVIDAAKAIAALTPNAGELLDYLEVIGKGKKLAVDPIPFIAIPTTSGTGAEVTKNAVVHSPEHNVKVSLRSQLMFADVAVVDPKLAISMPPKVTATSGMDALTHLLETFVSNQSNPFIDHFCRDGMLRISKSLVKVYKNGNDLEAREDMAMASLLGGMALANVKLGAVHGFAGPMGGMFPAPHGAVCACLLPAVMEENLKAVSDANLKNIVLKYDEIAQILTDNQDAEAKDGISWVNERISDFEIPCLSDFGMTEADFPELIEKAKKASSMKGNPVVLSNQSLNAILTKSA